MIFKFAVKVFYVAAKKPATGRACETTMRKKPSTLHQSA